MRSGLTDIIPPELLEGLTAEVLLTPDAKYCGHVQCYTCTCPVIYMYMYSDIHVHVQ